MSGIQTSELEARGVGHGGLVGDLARRMVVKGVDMQTGLQTGIQTWATTATAADVQRLAGVPSAIASVEATMAGLAESVSRLVDRLEKAGVVIPAPPQAASTSQPQAPAYATSLANAIDRFRARGQALSAAVNDLRERIDL